MALDRRALAHFQATTVQPSNRYHFSPLEICSRDTHLFQHLKLLPYKALSETVLYDLGKINIVCGKNSSGKSTFLSAVANPETRRIGQKLNEQQADALVKGSIYATGWNGTGEPRLNKAYYEVMLNIAQSKQVWFGGEEMTFVQQFVAAFRANPYLTRWAFAEGHLLDIYKQMFKDEINSVIVAPKRYIELNSTIRMDATVLPHGYGLLPYLFFAKNQASDTLDGQLHAKLLEVFSDISSGARFNIIPMRDGNLRLYFAQGQQWTSAEDAGLGLQELLVILFFAVNPNYQSVLLEEPESHLHPEWQRRLLSYLRNGTDKQYFLSTHSNIFLDAGLIDRVFFTNFRDKIIVDDATKRSAVLSELGYSVTDNLVSDLIILVEGPKDAQVVEEFLIKMAVWGNCNVKIWPLGGDIMGQVDLTVFVERNNILALIDKDPGSANTRKKFVAKCAGLNIPVTRLKRYAMENYFSLRAIREVYQKHQWETNIFNDINELAPNTKVEGQIGMDIKRNSRLIATEMTLNEVENTGDLYDFLQIVRQKCLEID